MYFRNTLTFSGEVKSLPSEKCSTIMANIRHTHSRLFGPFISHKENEVFPNVVPYLANKYWTKLKMIANDQHIGLLCMNDN
jgi:hypothetical protein